MYYDRQSRRKRIFTTIILCMAFAEPVSHAVCANQLCLLSIMCITRILGRRACVCAAFAIIAFASLIKAAYESTEGGIKSA